MVKQVRKTANRIRSAQIFTASCCERFFGSGCSQVVNIIAVAIDDGEEGLERINGYLHESTLWCGMSPAYQS